MDAILAGLDSVEEARREQAIKQCAASADPRAYLYIEDHVTREPNPRLKFQAETALRTMGAQLRASFPPCVLTDVGDRKQLDSRALTTLIRGELKGASEEDRKRAISALCTFRNESLAPLLDQALVKESSLNTRGLLLIALGANAGAAQVERLGSFLGVKEAGLRQCAVDALIFTRESAAYPHFVRALADPDPTVRKRAYRPLARLGGAQLVRFFQRILQAGQDWERMALARALVVFRGNAFRQLLALATRDRHAQVRAQALSSVNALAKAGDEAAAKILAGLEKSEKESPAVKTSEAEGTSVKDPGEAPAKEPAPAPPPPPGRKEDNLPPEATTSAEELSLVAVAGGKGSKTYELEDPSPEARMKAVEALAKDMDDDALKTLARCLEVEENQRVVAFVVTVLGRSGEDWLAANVRPFLSHKDPRVRSSAVDALGRILPNDQKKGVLRLFLTDGHNRIRSSAILALSAVEGVNIVDPLNEMLENDEPAMKKSGIYTLVALEREDMARHLVSLAKDDDEEISKMAREGLENLADGGSKSAKRCLKRLDAHPTAPTKPIKKIEYGKVAPGAAKRKPAAKPTPTKEGKGSKAAKASRVPAKPGGRPWLIYFPIFINLLLSLVSLLGGLETRMDSGINLPLGIAFCLFFLALGVILFRGISWGRWLQIVVAFGGAILFWYIELPWFFAAIMLAVFALMFLPGIRDYCVR